MEGDKHFSHDHPLTSFVDKEMDSYEHEKPNYLCNICGLPILSCPSYTCVIDSCKFFLHKPCAQVPKELSYPSHDPESRQKHTLHLKSKSPPGQNFTYKCEKCEFDLHPLRAFPVEIKTDHISHPPHPLVVTCRETLSQCDTCGEEHKGFFFCCQECNFWIHQDCALLPSVVKLPSHRHPSVLTFSLPSDIRCRNKCFICDQRLHLTYSGVYLCGVCNAYAHVKCAKSSTEDLRTEFTRLELLQLPDEEDTFPSLTIRNFIQKNPLAQHHDEMECHEHPLIFDNGVSSSSSTSGEESCNLLCDVCIQPINTPSPFYKCLDCHFLAHHICADHLCKLKQPYGVSIICPDPSNLVFNSVFPCRYCHRPCNGLPYYRDYGDQLGLFYADPECLLAPYMTKHASHRQHILFQTLLGSSGTNHAPICCSGESFEYDIYRCFVCDFYIHIRCALLPKRTRHKFDEHPLELIMTPHQNKSINEGQECRLCEFCEQDINLQYWYYGCGECKQYFHIDCIPSVGYLSKVKFGKTLVGTNIHPDHPLTLTRMLTHESHEMCGHCNQIIKGFADEMAFRCSPCDFWIHFSCARDSSSTPRLKLHSEVEIKYKERSRALSKMPE